MHDSRRARGAGAALASALAITAFAASPAHAQNQPSLRIQSLGPVFAGVVDDEISDAWGNPARVGAIRDRSFYTGRFSGQPLYLQFPYFQPSSYQIPLEGLSSSLWQTSGGNEPLGATVFTGVRHGMRAAVSVDAAVYGRDQADGTNEVSNDTRYVGDGLSVREQAYAYQRDINRVVFSVALASAADPGESSKGVRVRVEYRDSEGTNASASNTTEFPLSNPSQLVSRFSTSRTSNRGKELHAAITAGVYRPRSALRDAALSVGVVTLEPRQKMLYQDVFDEDLDGDGNDPSGFAPEYDYRTALGESSRHFKGASGGARVVLAWGDHVRSVHRANVAVLQGDGDARSSYDDITRDAGNDTSFRESLGYTYDGTVTLVSTSSVLGFRQELREGVLVAGALSGYYSRDEFEEDATGSGTVAEGAYGASSSMSTAFDQSADMVEEKIQATLALAVEWQVTRYAALRFGVLHYASHDKVDGSLRQNIALEGTPNGLDSGDNSIDYGTSTEFRTGIGVTLADRLTVDLQMVSTYEVSLADYAYATALYRF